MKALLNVLHNKQLVEAKESLYLEALKEPEPNEIELDILTVDINELASEISKIEYVVVTLWLTIIFPDMSQIVSHCTAL